MSKLLEKINNEARKKLLLSDYIKIKHGFAFKGEYFSVVPTKDILVTPGNFAIGGGFKIDKFKYYNGLIPEDYILKENDLIVTMTDLSVNADTLGYSALVPHDGKHRFLHNQRIGLVQKRKDGIDFNYLNYLMHTRQYQKYVVSTASGSTVKHTSPDKIASYEYNFPSLPTQKTIAGILSAYDAKIENNNKIIKNLEQTAQTIFDEWFVNFQFPGHEKVKMVDSEMGEIPDGWKVTPLDQIAEYLNGVASQKYPAENEKDTLPVIKIREMNSGVDSSSDRATKNIDQKYIIKNGDILFSWSGSLVLMIWTGVEGVLNQHIFKVTSESYPKWFIYQWTKYYLRNFQKIAEGKATTMGHIQRHHLSESLVIVPDDLLLSKADIILGNFFDQQILLQIENISLKSQRDQLLVKLI